MTKRRFSDKPLPSYIFIPGQNPHPKKEGGHMEGQSEPVAEPLTLDHPEKSPEFCFGVDLFNYHYYWESHVYFEALWNAHHRQGEVADFFKALIKLSAAEVKKKLNQEETAREHYLRAIELFEGVKLRCGPNYLGFNLDELLGNVRRVLESHCGEIFLNPSWD